MEDTFEEQFSDFSLGIMDSLSVVISVSSGLYIGGANRHIIIFGILSETLSGMISMGLSDYLSIDTLQPRKDIAWKSGLRTGFGYFIGGLIPLIGYLITNDKETGFIYSIILNTFALVIFGYIRAIYLKINITESLTKILSIGIITIVITFNIIKFLNKF